MDNEKVDYTSLGQERIISIADLIEEVLKKIWIVIIVAVLAAGIAGGYKYGNDKKLAKESNSSVASVLTKSEKEEVNEALTVYDNYKEQKQYLKDSVLMQVDAFNESNVILQYYINERATGDASKGKELVDSYQNYINNGGLAADLVNSGVDMEIKYVGELLTGISNFDDSVNISTTNTYLDEKSNVFSVKVIQVDENSCNELADKVVECLNNYQASLSETLENHALVLTNRSYTEVVDKTLWTYKTDRVKSAGTINDSYKSLTNNMTAEQKAILEKYENGEKVSTKSETTEEAAPVEVHISKKTMVLGGVIGLVIAAVFIALRYMLRGSLNKANDLQYLYNVRVLSEIEGKHRNNVLVRLWHRILGITRTGILSKEAGVTFSAKKICDALEKSAEKTVLLLCENLNHTDMEWISKLQNVLNGKNVEVKVMSQRSSEVELYDCLDTCKNVVMVEKIEASRYEEIADMLQCCMEQDAKVIGAVVLH